MPERTAGAWLVRVDTSSANVSARVRESGIGLPNAMTVTPTWTPDNGRGSTVNVTAQMTYHVLVPLVPLPDITVKAESTLVINN